jgi:anaerobic selenocysteine-containing dehydrogenase
VFDYYRSSTTMNEQRIRGVCPLDCQDSCSWFAHVVDGVVVRMTGAADHPITRGSLCTKVNDYHTRTYSPDRVLRPLRRVGPKRAARFEPIGWGEAIDTIVTRFEAIIRAHGPAALTSFDYAGSIGWMQRRALRRIFHALGASRQIGNVCGQSGAFLMAEGTPRGFDPEELVDSRLIVLWGSNILSTAPHTFRFMLDARRRHGTRLVAIDPRRTITAARCDRHIAIRPGTDHLFALAVAHVLLRDGLADREFADKAAVDLDAFEREAAAWPPSRAALLCGVSETEIADFARELGSARPAAIRAGIGPQQTVVGEQFVRSLSALAVLGGHWQHRGGGLFVATSPIANDAKVGCPELGPAPRSLDMARLGEYLTDRTLDPPIAGLMVWGANPAVTQPDAGRVQEGLARDDLFLVVAEHFLTDTARLADIVLPSTTQLEHFDVQGAWGHHYISVNQPAIAPLGEAKSHGEMMRLLAARLGLEGPRFRDSDEEIAASGLPEGLTLDELKARGFVKRSPPRPSFGPGAVRVRIHEVPDVPARPAGLQLLTPKAHHFLNSTFANLPAQQRGEKRPTLHMHPEDARARGLADGAEARVANERGTLRATIELTRDICRGTVALPGKWWGVAAANLLSAPRYSPAGQPAYNDIYVEVSSDVEASRDRSLSLHA